MNNILKSTCILSIGLSRTLFAEDFVELPSIEIEGRDTIIVGEAISASQGYIGQVDLAMRPMLRTGEILEAVPGLIVTQHSGSGKANQYFLRGFNLDHGTDFATWVDGMPVNMVSHGHGQGYTDLNFIIPEITDTISYLKGSYYSAVGDFSSAGSASIQTMDKLNSDIAKVTIGEDGYFRALVAGSQSVSEGNLLYALERNSNNGPWEIDEDLDKLNGVLKFTHPITDGEISVTARGYDSSWNSSDQIPERAVEQGLTSEFGSIDETVGGKSSRYSLSTNWHTNKGNVGTKGSLYAMYYDMNLWSNFTYFLDDPVNGDQFQQADRRMIYGGSFSRSWYNQELFDKTARHTIGFQTRFDDVDNVGLYHTVARNRIGTTREDTLNEFTGGIFYDGELQWTSKFRTNLGIRADYFDYSVDSDNAANSGSGNDFLVSPKLNAIYTANENTEYYLSLGYGFHSNDVRGTTISVDPSDGVTPVQPVDPLVKSKGGEIGVRYNWNEKLNTSVAIWGLELDSELLYVGDAGNTEASRPSERYGLELANFYALNDAVSIDLDLAFTNASFQDNDPSGNEIPGAIDRVASLGINYQPASGIFGSIRYRHFGERPLIEDNTVQSESFSAVNARLGYKTESWQLSLDFLNGFDSDDHDITYFYASRLPGEPAEGVEDRHFHIIEPSSLRLNFSLYY